jgi:CBS domain-containing protein
MHVRQILATARKRLFAVRSDAPLTLAAKLLGGGCANLVVVCDLSGMMVGVVTKTDIVRRISSCCGNACTLAVFTVMTRDVCYCRPNDLLQEVWRTMKERDFREVPVIGRDFRPLGVISARDALDAMLVNVDHEETQLREYVMGNGYH